MAWTTPKTNWKSSTKFTYTDYNRIKNNLMFLNDMLNEMYPDKAVPLDLGSDLSYESNYLPSQFNAFEDALQSFTRVGENVNVGTRKTYCGNANFIGYKDLNRIESCCLKWRNYTPPVTTSISIKPTAQSLNVGNSCTFSVICKPDKAQDKENYTVTSSDTSKVTVVKDGMNVVATALEAGSATITVSNNGHSATATIVTQLILVTSIKPSATNFILNKDESKVIDLVFSPANAYNIKDWTISANNSNASVTRINDTQIQVTGVTGGDDTLITITCGDVSTTIRATVPVILNDLWLSYNKMDASYEGNLEANCPRVTEWQTATGMTWIDTLYVVTDPISAYKSNYSLSSSNRNAVNVYKESWNETDKIFIVGQQVGKTANVTVMLGGLSWTVKVKVH